MEKLVEWFLKSLNPKQVCILCLLVMGGCVFYATNTFADTQVIDAKIVAAIQPILVAQQAAAREQAEYRHLLIETLTSSKAAEIRALALKRCRTKIATERESLNAEIDRRQEEYERIKRRRYEIPGCDEL